MAEELAAHYREPVVEEFAVEYLEKLTRTYEYDDLRHIAIGQLIIQNRKHQQAKNLLVLDTDLTVIKIWGEYKFGNTDPFIDNLLKTNLAGLYLLMDVDLPYEHSPLRENPDLDERKELFALYEKLLKKLQVPYVIISGSEKERTRKAISAVDSFLETQKSH
mgnify:CR=1 FL=1